MLFFYENASGELITHMDNELLEWRVKSCFAGDEAQKQATINTSNKRKAAQPKTMAKISVEDKPSSLDDVVEDPTQHSSEIHNGKEYKFRK